MADLETRLREAVADRSDAFVPSPDLPERAVRRARQRERSRRLALVGTRKRPLPPTPSAPTPD
jgi:hypothetical protein